MKQTKIFVALGLSGLLSLLSIIAPPPIQAAAEANTWTEFSVPEKGKSGGWLLTSDITGESTGITAVCADTEGTVYIATEEITGSPLNGYNLFKSTDYGYTWTRLWELPDDDKPSGGAVTDPDSQIIELMMPRPEDTETIYLATQYNVYKSTDGGENFDEVGYKPAYGSGANVTSSRLITSLDVTFYNDHHLVLVGSRDADTGDFGGGYIYDESKSYTPWADLWVGGQQAGNKCDVLDVAFSPNFSDDQQIVALITDETKTVVTSKLGWADWGRDIGDATLAGIVPIGGRLAFPSDYDAEVSSDKCFLYAGLNATIASAVYMIAGGDAPDASVIFPMFIPDTTKAVHSLTVAGEAFNATIIAGLTSGNALYSDREGLIWRTAHTPPSVTATASNTCVALGGLHLEEYIVYAGTSGINGGFARSVDSGDTFVQTAFICDDLVTITDIAVSPNYNTDNTIYMITVGHSTRPILWRTTTGGEIWEAILTGGQVVTLPSDLTRTVPDFDKVTISPGFAYDVTVFVCQSDADEIWRSTDNGFSFTPIRSQAGTAGDIDAWAIVDIETILIGDSNGNFYQTTDNGKTWNDAVATGLSRFNHMALSPDYEDDDTIVAGDGDGSVFISEDAGEDWEQVGNDLAAADDTFVAFDPDYPTSHIIYAASGDEIYRCIVDPSQDWEEQKWKEFTTDVTEASGIAITPDGVLYTSDDEAGAGGWRSLNPTDDMDDVIFEQVDTELDSGAELTSLQVTTGSDILWSRNAEAGAKDELWTYQDNLTTSVVLTSPEDNGGTTDTDQATLEWEELAGVEKYELKWTDDPSFIAHVTTVTDIDDTSYLVEDLNDGEVYYWKVRVQQGEPLLSRWSEEWSFTTKLAAVGRTIEWMPENGAQDVVVCPSFGWTRVSGATTYELELADNPDFTSAPQVTTTINSWECDSDLAYSTTYYWRTRALKDSVVISSWRSGAFTTMAEPAPPVEIKSPPPPQITPPAPPPPPQPKAPPYLWVWIGVSGALLIAVLVLIVKYR